MTDIPKCDCFLFWPASGRQECPVRQEIESLRMIAPTRGLVYCRARQELIDLMDGRFGRTKNARSKV